MVLADSIDEQLDVAAARAGEHVELFALDEELTQLTQHAPIGTFVKSLRTQVLEAGVAAQALDRSGVGHVAKMLLGFSLHTHLNPIRSGVGVGLHSMPGAARMSRNQTRMSRNK
jgi:hypothetical protein